MTYKVITTWINFQQREVHKGFLQPVNETTSHRPICIMEIQKAWFQGFSTGKERNYGPQKFPLLVDHGREKTSDFDFTPDFQEGTSTDC